MPVWTREGGSLALPLLIRVGIVGGSHPYLRAKLLLIKGPIC